MTLKLIGFGILAIVIIVFVIRYAGKGKLKIKSIFGEVTAEGENAPPLTTVRSGVTIKDAQAGRDVSAHSGNPGGVDLEKIRAQRDIQATHSAANPPPKG